MKKTILIVIILFVVIISIFLTIFYNTGIRKINKMINKEIKICLQSEKAEAFIQACSAIAHADINECANIGEKYSDLKADCEEGITALLALKNKDESYCVGKADEEKCWEVIKNENIEECIASGIFRKEICLGAWSEDQMMCEKNDLELVSETFCFVVMSESNISCMFGARMMCENMAIKNIAISTYDPELCNRINYGEDRKECLDVVTEALAVRIDNISLCEEISNGEIKMRCLEFFAMREREDKKNKELATNLHDFRFCANITNVTVKTKCFDFFEKRMS